MSSWGRALDRMKLLPESHARPTELYCPHWHKKLGLSCPDFKTQRNYRKLKPTVWIQTGRHPVLGRSGISSCCRLRTDDLDHIGQIARRTGTETLIVRFADRRIPESTRSRTRGSAPGLIRA